MYNQNMNINADNAEKLFVEGGNAQEVPQEQRDPIEDLNPIQLLKRPDDFKQSFFSMVCLSTEAFKAKNYDRAALALTKCTDMLDLGRNILKDINRYWKLVVYANLACCYHYTRKLSKCNKFCQRIKEQLQKIMGETQQKEVFLKLGRLLIKLKFQHCAILSQLQQHNRAFQLCKSTIPMLKQYIESLLAYVQVNSTLDPLQKKSSETVQFSRQVHKFAETLLSDLVKCISQPLKAKQRTAFYYWQKNPEQNQQQVKKKFIPHSENNNCKRSILGVSKSTHWIDEFNIGTIMHFSEMNINDFDGSIPIEQYLFKDKLYELVIYCSMAHFTMATELRLIESNEQTKTETEVNAANSYSNLMKKYGYEEKSELFKLSEIYHLRSIQIMARNIKTTVPYITHIIRSYEKHYIKHKKILEPIAAIVQESALSLNESVNQKPPKQEDQEGYYETTYNNYLIKNNEKVLERNQYENEQIADLLLESQKMPLLGKKSMEKKDSQIEKEKKGELTKEPELNSLIEPPKEEKKEMGRESVKDSKLMTVKSDGNLRRQPLESPRDQANNSGEYLKSQRKETSRVKKLSARQKSASKLNTLRGSNPSNHNIKTHHKETKKQVKVKTQVQRYNDYKLKPQKVDKKEKDRKTIKKQKEKLLDIDHDKYNEREIKIKTESCTHIKVVYKKKK